MATISYLSQVQPDEARSALLGHRTDDAVTAFLRDLSQAGRSRHTVRAYAGDLRLLTDAAADLRELTPELLRGLFTGNAHLSVATRARRQAAAASFTAWAFREGLLDVDPMGRVARVRLDPPLPRGISPEQMQALLAAIPVDRLRDRVLLTLLATTGLRVGEALALHVDDLVLTRDDERLSVLGKGGRRRTVLLDDPTLVRLLRRYVRERGYQHGPLFRAERGIATTPLRYQSIQPRFAQYARLAGLEGFSLHDLRHGHAQALVNGGVSLATIRKRLGHANINTTLRYAEQADEVADAELRAWRRAQPSPRR